jgi:hypothetical protein
MMMMMMMFHMEVNPDSIQMDKNTLQDIVFIVAKMTVFGLLRCYGSRG